MHPVQRSRRSYEALNIVVAALATVRCLQDYTLLHNHCQMLNLLNFCILMR